MSLDRRPDFRRPVVSLLGLPFDAIDMPGAVAAVRDAAFSGRRLLVSTPNLDFAVAALQDPAFRRSVLRSDLSLVDGMPLVWLSRLLGLPVRERVSGSDLFEALRRHPGPPVRVYFYGGPPGVAAEAARRVNAERGGLVCVGHDEAGHGDVASMSSAGTLAAINAARPHFVALSLGARKGQAWLEANAERLDAPVLCYIGATVNFIAGAVPRAPVWMRRAGLEWVWRVAHEPALWRRYGHDAATLLPLVFTRVLPDALASRRRPDGSGGLGAQRDRLRPARRLDRRRTRRRPRALDRRARRGVAGRTDARRRSRRGDGDRRATRRPAAARRRPARGSRRPRRERCVEALAAHARAPLCRRSR